MSNRGHLPVNAAPAQLEVLGGLTVAVRDARVALGSLTDQASRVASLLPASLGLLKTLILEAAESDVSAARIDQARAAAGSIDADLRALGRLYVVAAERCEELLAAAARVRAERH